MLRTLALSLVAALTFSLGSTAVAAPRAGDFPEPSPYPITWELKFEHGRPKRIVVTVPGRAPQAYWYMTYRVTNETGQEQLFLPEFEMLTSDGKVIRSDKSIHGRVFQQIKEAEGSRLLERPSAVMGKLRAGEDQARDSVAIWKEPMLEMGEFSIFVTGLSGESVTYKTVDGELVKIDPRNAAEEMKGVAKEQFVTLSKTLKIDHVVYGDERHADRAEVTPKGERWVMR